MTDSDLALSQQLKSWYIQYKHDAARLAYYYLHDWHAAEDIVHLTFAEMYRRIKKTGSHSIRKFRPYLMQAIRHGCHDRLQHPEHATIPLDSIHPDTFVTLPEASTDTAEAIQKALSSLPPEPREVIVLKILQGFTFAEVSDITGLPQGTVHSHYRRGIEKMRNACQHDRN